MALNTELLITLQMLPNIGNKTILKFAQSVNTNSIEDLSECIRAIKKGVLQTLTTKHFLRLTGLHIKLWKHAKEKI